MFKKHQYGLPWKWIVSLLHSLLTPLKGEKHDVMRREATIYTTMGLSDGRD
jgi:hypothetical protein